MSNSAVVVVGLIFLTATIVVGPANADELSDALAAIGLTPDQITKAKEAIKQNQPPSPPPSASPPPTPAVSPVTPPTGMTPVSGPSSPAPSSGSGCCPHGKLKVDGAQLVGEDGKPVQLRGMSLFWSNAPEGAPFFNEETVKCLKCNWNADIVRAPLGVEDPNNYLQNPDTEYQKELAVVKAAEKNCMYVLIDWHYTSSTAYPDKAEEFFKKISAECAGKCNCLYETWNEPTSNSWSDLKAYHERMIKAIRANDPDGVIIAGTPNWDQDVDKAAADPITDQKNIMYTLHFYAATHKAEGSGSVGEKVDTAISKKLPLFVTEYGTTSADGNGNIDTAETQKWYDKLDQNKISYINWAIDNKNEKSAALTGSDVKPADVCTDSKDSESGAFVKKMLRKQNPKPSGC